MKMSSVNNAKLCTPQIWDICVVGAGPAGATAARLLALNGNRVLLVDKARWPRPKVCGCCLNRHSQSTLQEIGLGDLTRKLGAIHIHRFRIGAANRTANIHLAGTVSLSRQALDAALVQAAIDAGTQFLPRTEARLAPAKTGFPSVALGRGSDAPVIRARVLLAADGVGSALMNRSSKVGSRVQGNSRVGAGVIVDQTHAAYRPGTIYMACGRDGYVGLVRLEDGRLDMAAALDRGPIKRQGGIGPLAAQIINQSGFPKIAGLENFNWQGTPLLSRAASQVYDERTFLIGDAAGYVEPFTGEGIAWALASGAAVAPLAGQAVSHWHSQLGRQWTRQYQRIVKRRQWLCRFLANGLRYPGLTRSAIWMISTFPLSAQPFARALTRQ